MPDDAKPKAGLLDHPALKALASVADAITVGGIALGAAVLITGYIANQLVPALALALALSVGLNAYLLIRAVPKAEARGFEEMRHRVLNTLGANPHATKRWLAKPKDLSSLKMTNADLDDALARGHAHAVKKLGDDAISWCRYFHVSGSGSIFVSVDAESYVAQKAIHMLVYEGTEDNFRVTRHEVAKGRSLAEIDRAPWRKSDRWNELYHKAFARLGPFEGSIDVVAGAEPEDASDDGAKYVPWTIKFKPEKDDVEEPFTIRAVMTHEGDVSIYRGSRWG